MVSYLFGVICSSCKNFMRCFYTFFILHQLIRQMVYCIYCRLPSRLFLASYRSCSELPAYLFVTASLEMLFLVTDWVHALQLCSGCRHSYARAAYHITAVTILPMCDCHSVQPHALLTRLPFLLLSTV